MKAAKTRSFLRRGVLLLLAVLLLFATGCNPSSSTSSSAPSPSPSLSPSPSPSPTPTPETEQTISGMLIKFANDLFTLRTDDNQEYTFDTANVTITGLPGVYIGDLFTISYIGNLDSGNAVQNVSILAVEKTQEGEESDSIPLAWKDNGVFASCYSKAYVALESLSTEEKVGQLLLGRVPESRAGSDVVAYHLGGYVTFGRDYEGKTRWQVQNMIQGWQSAAKIPLLIAVDEEGGDVVRISSNSNLRGVPFRSPQLVYAMGGMEMIQSDAKEKAQLLLDLGVNVNLAPVADVSTDPNDFIYSRSFGQGAEETAEYVITVMEQFHKQGISSVLKHFPGYGSNSDTHTGASLDERTLFELKNRDLIPFQKAIDEGAYAVMISHNTVACMDDKLPASLSPAVHRYLRETMGFTGIIMTDDLSMDAISKEDLGLEHSVYVQAVLAGNDVILCSDYKTAYEDILAAVKDGTIPEETLNRAVFRILSWKSMLELI